LYSFKRLGASSQAKSRTLAGASQAACKRPGLHVLPSTVANGHETARKSLALYVALVPWHYSIFFITLYILLKIC